MDGGGERLTLLRADEPSPGSGTIPLVIEDRVDYDDTPPWPASADGNGESLHRTLSDQWAGDVTSWSNGPPSPGRFGPRLTAQFAPLGDGQVVTFPLNVSATGTVRDVNVILDLQHSSLEDLDVHLETPDGALVELFTDVGGGGDHLHGTVLDDEASQPLGAGVAPFIGHFQPEGALHDFRGKAVNGAWTLHVTDDTANGDAGQLVTASLAIELVPEMAGNVNHDSQLDADDIDVMFANLGSTVPTFDLDDDGDADDVDVDELVLNIMGARYGDADLDDDVDISDFQRLVSNFDPLGTGGFASWRSGNFDGDVDIDIDDFNLIAVNFAPLGFSSLASVEGSPTVHFRHLDITFPGIAPWGRTAAISTTIETGAFSPSSVQPRREIETGAATSSGSQDIILDARPSRNRRKVTEPASDDDNQV